MNVFSTRCTLTRVVEVIFQDMNVKNADADPCLLMGICRAQKQWDFGSGYLSGACGEYLPDENDPVEAARRIGQEKTGLIGNCNMIVGRRVVIMLKHLRFYEVELVIFTNPWSGKLIENNRFFYGLDFVRFSQINWSKTTPQYFQLIRNIFKDHRPEHHTAINKHMHDQEIHLEVQPLYPVVHADKKSELITA